MTDHIRPVPPGAKGPLPGAPTLSTARTTRTRAAGGTPSASRKFSLLSAAGTPLLAATLLLAGCGHTQEERALEAAQFRSWLAGVEGADAAVESLLADKEKAEAADLGHVVEIDLREAAVAVPEWDAEGKPLPARLFVPLDEVLTVGEKGEHLGGSLVDYARGRDDILAAREKFLHGWEKPILGQDGKPVLDEDGRPRTEHQIGWLESRQNFTDAIRLRDEIRQSLEKAGIDPADAEAFARGVADYVSKRR